MRCAGLLVPGARNSQFVERGVPITRSAEPAAWF